MKSRLVFTHGTMESAKTAQLLMDAYGLEQNGKKIMAIKPATDDRDEDLIRSRIGLARKADHLIVPSDNLFDLVPDDINSLFVDEVQFLGKEQIDQLRDIVYYKDINVFTYGLKTNFKTEFFEGSRRLFELTPETPEREFFCQCGQRAMVNARFKNGVIEIDGPEVVIEKKGSIYSYRPLCMECYLRYVDEKFKLENGRSRILLNNN